MKQPTLLLPFLLFLIPTFLVASKIGIHLPSSSNIKPVDEIAYSFQLGNNDVFLFSFLLKTGCYVSKNFYQLPPQFSSTNIRLIKNVEIKSFPTECPCFYGSPDFPLNQLLTFVDAVRIKHTQFHTLGEYYSLLYGIVDFKNKTASTFAVVKVTNISQHNYLDVFMNESSFLSFNLIQLIKLFNKFD